MDASKLRRLRGLFDQATELDAAARAKLLRTVGQEDADLAQELASLLAADAQHQVGVTEQSDRVRQVSFAAIDAPGVAVGDRIGPYILCEQLGHGGMGLVFRAQRADGRVQQEVALKIVRRALLDAAGRERFLREREIVAAFQHPSIARMLDVGETADGSPYLAMELIRGVPITVHCDALKLDVRARVEVFLRVCEAVQHAHANLVLHRDLKPSNVMVGEDGQPKLIDFGIAKPLGILADEDYQRTDTTHRFFSPSNAAPEQLRGQRAGVACDVYQLGTLLYELLCGATVFDPAGLTAGQFEQRVLETIPESPSLRGSRSSDIVAQARGAASAAALSKDLRGDLDAIVAHALRKSPSERYGSVEQLADDLRRYLDGLPVAARRGRRWYRIRKFLRRHALPAALSVAAAALIALFVVALWLQSQRIAQERNLAQQRASDVEQVARFEADMLKQADPTKAGQMLTEDMHVKFAQALVEAGVPESERAGQAATFATLLQRVNATDTARDLTDRTILRPAVAAADQRFKNQPLVAATLHQVLADRYVEMGMYETALPLQQSALATRRRLLGPMHQDTLISVNGMGELLQGQYKWDQAEPYYREALEKRRRVLGGDHPDTIESMRGLGEVLVFEGKLGQGAPYLRQALAESRKVKGSGDRQTLYLINDVGSVLQNEHRQGEAVPYFREAVEKSRRVLGEDDPETLQSVSNLGWALWHQGELAEAEPYLRESLEDSRRVLGEEHPDTLDKLNIMGLFLMAQGRHAEAETCFREVLAKRGGVWSDDNPFTLVTMTRLSWTLELQGKLGQAEAYRRELLERRRSILGAQAPDTILAMDGVGRLLVEQGKLADAEPVLREALETSRQAFGDDDWNTQFTAVQMGSLLIAQGKYVEAENLLAPAEAQTRDGATADDSLVHAMILLDMGQAHIGLRDFAAAESELLEANQAEVKNRSWGNGDASKYVQALVALYGAWNLAEPGKGLAAKAAVWKRQLGLLDGLAQASTPH